MAGRSSRAKLPTQVDVAQLAGVSRTTVSYVLNGSQAISVPDETRQRILAAADQLGYVPDRVARSLRTRQTYTIAGLIPDITNPFHPALERGIQDVAERFGYDLIVYNSDGVREKEQKCCRSLLQGRVDGAIIESFHLTLGDMRTLLDRNIAVVKVEGRPVEQGDLPLDVIYFDEVGGARTAVEHLVERGHTRIGMLAGEGPPRQNRFRGYRQALANHDIPVDETLVKAGNIAVKDGYAGMQALLSARPTAIFAVSDLLAMGAMQAIREAGLRVPDDVAVVGFDNIFAAELVTPPLTTIAVPQQQLGRRAAEMLFERLDGRVTEGGRCEEVPFELIVRAST